MDGSSNQYCQKCLNQDRRYSSSNSSTSSASGQSISNKRNEYTVDYGFKIRGDAPVIISSVKPNSLADVSETFIDYILPSEY